MNKNMTVASWITLCRLVLIFPICSAIISKAWGAAFLCTVFAGLTDVLDGFIARYLNQETAFGAFLDAFVDKVLMGAIILSYLATNQNIPFLWQCLGIFIISKELVQIFGTLFLFVKGNLQTVKPSLWGKASMCGQLIFVLLLMFNSTCNYVISLCILIPIFLLLFASGLSYGALFIKLIR
jgi:phosphatidylglycerophosphate synthase